MRILLTEDNSVLANLIKSHLSKFYVLDLAFNLAEARYFLDTKSYDLLVLDLLLPDGNSLELCEYLQENKIIVPILFLTAEFDAEKKITCLQNGNDFLAKPFNLLELEARINNLTKKVAKDEKAKILEYANLRIEQNTHQVFYDNEEIKLNRKEFALLELFLSRPKQILSKASLAEKIWQGDEVLFGNSIETTITNLRRKLGRKLIKAVKGVGYIFSPH